MKETQKGAKTRKLSPWPHPVAIAGNIKIKPISFCQNVAMATNVLPGRKRRFKASG